MRSLLLLPLFGLASCSLLPQPEESPVTPPLEIDVPAELVLEALPAVYDSVGLAQGFVESEAAGYGSVQIVSLWSPWIGPPDSPDLRCTGPAFAHPLGIIGALLGIRPVSTSVSINVPPAQVTLSVSTAVSVAESTTQVQTHVRASSAPIANSAADQRVTYCVSTGRLERRIAELLQSRLSQQTSA